MVNLCSQINKYLIADFNILFQCTTDDGKVIQLLVEYLCVPATSVPAERVFLCTGKIINSKQACTHPENVSMLCFFIIICNLVVIFRHYCKLYCKLCDVSVNTQCLKQHSTIKYTTFILVRCCCYWHRDFLCNYFQNFYNK